MLLSPQAVMLENSFEPEMAGAKSTGCTGAVCLNELFVNAVGQQETGAVGPSDWSTGEWVELHNNGGSDVDLSGWYLQDHSSRQMDISITSSPVTVVWPQNSQNLLIPAGGYMVVARNGDGQNCGHCMTNSQGVVSLYDSNSVIQHQATWSVYATSGYSLVQGSSPTADWDEVSTITPGGINSGGGVSGPTWNTSDLRITEVLADAWPSNDNDTYPSGEWVEIENTGNSAMNLSGWSIKDLTGNKMNLNYTHVVDYNVSHMIQPNERRIVANIGLERSGVFNNGGDSAFLINPNGEYVAAANYSSNGIPGHSFIAPTIGNGNWVMSLFPTPGGDDARNVNSSSPVRINEVMVNATNSWLSYPNGNWIELSHRSSDPAVDVTGWNIISGTGQLFNLDAGFSGRDTGSGLLIDSGSYVVLSTPPTTGQMLVNGDTVSLVDGVGNIVDSVSWGGDFGSNRTAIPTDPDLPAQPMMVSGWVTPAMANPNQMTSSVNESADFRISELMPNPIGSDSNLYPEGEWVEIVNVGNDTASFQGWKIRDGRNISLALDSLSIPGLNESSPSDWELDAGEHLVVWRNGRAMSLQNSGDAVSLIDNQGEVVQTLVYSLTPLNSTLVSDSDIAGEWIHSPWPTPGSSNPLFDNPYTGATTLEVNEVMPQCTGGNLGIDGDWLEIHNPDSVTINLSRWLVVADSGDAMVLRSLYLQHYAAGVAYERSDWWNLDAGEYAVLIPENNGFLSNFDEMINLRDPNGGVRQEVVWSTSENCRSVEGDASAWSEDWLNTMWPTPGDENPEPTPWDTDDPVWFTKVMPGQIYNRNNEFIEITNMGNSILNLAGWHFNRIKSDGTANSGTFNGLNLQPGESMTLTQSPTNLSEDGGINAVDMNEVLDYAPWMYDSGSSLQLISPDGVIADTFVYGNGLATVSGWSGPAVSTPPTTTEGLIYMRGDGCDEKEDTNTSADWEVRWIRLGASMFCDSGVFSTTGSLEPMASPDGSLYQFTEWLDGSTTELHIHVYELMSNDIVAKLVQLSQANVDITIILEEDPFEDEEDLYKIRGMAYELYAGGITVYWMGNPRGENAPPAPYQYIHSKVAVRDGESVWIGSGNIKESTFPAGDYPSNRDWGLVINSQDVAQLVMSRMLWDENVSHPHLNSYSVMDPSTGKPSGWTSYGPSGIDAVPPTTTPPVISGDFTGQVLTCPDDCISGIINLLDSADTSIELSLQGFDMGWHWGFGDNPLVKAVERALQRGVEVRLLINGYYVHYDDDIRDTVNHFNNQWNRTDGYDATAILMAPAERITKLHNKGVIVDGESVLISSINWNSNAILRNREMGIVIHNTQLAAWYLSSFEEDWNRLDANTDTDGDNMPDAWELEYGLNRTSSVIPGSSVPEQSHDFDGDGLDNLQEMSVSADPNNPDTDGDCIRDNDELVFATLNQIPASDAILFADADNDGVADGEQTECGSNMAGSGDGTNNDGTNNDDDTTAPTIPEAENPLDSNAARVLLGIVGVAMVALVIALVAIIIGGRETARGVVKDDSFDLAIAVAQEEAFGAEESGSENQSENEENKTLIPDKSLTEDPKILSSRDDAVGRHDGVHGAPLLDGFEFEGWTPQQVQDALNEGSTVDQLREKYKQEKQ
jgi:phosphatidylserine/phosphatidylglycerophosphate/cardiolipin synthase-like enzyme